VVCVLQADCFNLEENEYIYNDKNHECPFSCQVNGCMHESVLHLICENKIPKELIVWIFGLESSGS